VGYLRLTGLLYCTVEPPDHGYPFQNAEGLWIADSRSGNSVNISDSLLATFPEEAFTHQFFVNDWNAFICIAAMDARFEWAQEPYGDRLIWYDAPRDSATDPWSKE